jgi:WASH complex subunit FAM21
LSETPSPISASSPAPPEAPGSSLLTTTGNVETTESAPVAGLDAKLWERAWSLDELKAGSQQWTLASDAGLLLYLQGFSQRLTSRTHEIEKQVDGLVQETDASQTRVQNAFNEFLMLANTQFVESRVYDEEERREDTEKAKKDEPEKTREQIEAEVIPRITSALQFGLDVLENAFDKIEVAEDERSSDEEGEGRAQSAEPLLEPKDPYIVRPLPHLIGSVKFLQDDDVGIGIPESEDEEEEEDGAGKSEHGESESVSETSSSEESGSDVVKAPKKTKKKKDSVSSDDLFGVGASPGSSTLSSDESDESASERQDDDGGDDDEEGKLKAASGHDFAAELAARIGAAVPKSAKESDDEAKHSDEDDDWKDEAEEENDAKTAPRKDKQKKKKKKKEKAKEEERKRKESGGLFDESGDDGLGGEAFEKDGLFSTKGGGLFDGSDEDEGSLFDDKPKKAPEPANAEPSLSTKKKPPPGAVPMFGGNLFGGADEDEEAVEEAPVPVVNKASTPAAKKTVGEGLFSSEGEENDDLFSTIAKPTVVDDQPKKATGLFDADDDNLFDKNEPNKPEGKQARKTKKPPVGGVSLFGGMMSPEGDEEDDLFSTIPSQSAAATSKSPGSKPTTAASGGLTSSLFDDDDEDDTQDDIFAIKSNTVEKGTLVKGTQPQESTAAKKKPVGGVSLFGGADLFGKSTEDIKPKAEKQAESEKPKASPAIDIEEDNEADLFSAQPKPAKQTAQPASTSTEKGGGGLFDDDDDDEENDLFAIKRAPQKEPPKEVKEVKKKPVGGVSLFGGKDLFGAEDKHPKAKVEEKKAVDKGPLLGNDDEDNDLFSSSKPTPKLAEKTVDRGPLGGSQSDHDLFGDSLKPKSRAQEQKPSQKGPLGLDDDDDDLFASPPSAKLKVEEKPKPTERGPLDFEDEDDDDLFSAFPSKPKDQPAASRPEAPSVTSKSSKPAEKIQASPKPAPTAATKATGGGLFGDDDDDDDDLFAPKKPSPQPAQNSPQPQLVKERILVVECSVLEFLIMTFIAFDKNHLVDTDMCSFLIPGKRNQWVVCLYLVVLTCLLKQKSQLWQKQDIKNELKK